jgi:hypothetical protein
MKDYEKDWTCSMHLEVRNTYKNLVRKLEGTRPFQSQRSRWKDNIKMDLRETGCDVVDSTLKIGLSCGLLCTP